MYVAIGGASPAFRYDVNTFSSMHVKFLPAFESVEGHIEGAEAYKDNNSLYVGVTKVGGGTPELPADHVLTATFPAGTDMAALHIDYTGYTHTSIEVSPDEDAIIFTGTGPYHTYNTALAACLGGVVESIYVGTKIATDMLDKAKTEITCGLKGL